MPNNKTFVISLGGSVMCPDKLDEKFIKNFRDFILRFVKNGYKFIIITGGGKLARQYQTAGANIAKITPAEKDWLGIEATKLNALLLKIIFQQKAHPQLLDEKGAVKNFGKYPIVVGCGWAPGWSTDYIAVQAAVNFKIRAVINLGKPHFVYTANPDKDPTAKPLTQVSWQDYFKIIPKKWTPGLSTPFDPTASRLAQKNKITVIVADGCNLPNFQKILNNQKFKGTTIL
ncbi:MAG: UMP kinase [Patescibacteria group bacterium]